MLPVPRECALAEKDCLFNYVKLSFFCFLCPDRVGLPRALRGVSFSTCAGEKVTNNQKAISSYTGSPSSKYEHRQASALLRNIQNIRICMGKKPTVSVTYENERISIKNSLPYLKCVLRLSCVVHGPNYRRFMGFYVNGFLSI